MNNIQKSYKFLGVGWLKYNYKWSARIMSNYQSIHIGNYETYEVIVSKGCKYSEKEILYKLSDIIAKTNDEANIVVNETNIEE